MIEARKKIIDCCGELSDKTAEVSLPENIMVKISYVSKEAREKMLVVPVVGAFSSGKSSLINNILGNKILPVDVLPETSLATELHYSPENYILAVKDNGETDRYKIDEIKTVTEKSKDYLYAQLYLNNDKLSEIEPLVLVDMPGFDSPLDLHNKAIMAYLNRGCYYIVLSSVEEGTITKSLERRLHEIEGYRREFSFFLSKANLRPKDSVETLVTYYQNQIENKFESKTIVTPLGETAEDVLKCLKGIDVNSIFLKLYKDVLLVICDDIITNLNLQINSSKKDTDKLKSAMDEMKNSIDKLKKKAESEIESMRRRYSGSLVNEIIADVSNALDSALDELSGTVISCGDDKSGLNQKLGRQLNEIVRTALTSSIRDKLDIINKQIAVDFSESLQDLDRIMKDLDLDDDYTNNIIGKVDVVLSIIDRLMSEDDDANPASRDLSSLTSQTAVNVGMKVLAGTLVAIPEVISTIIGIVLIFLPEILKLLQGDPKEKQKEFIRTKLSGEIFPSIKRKLRDEIPAALEDHLTLMIQNVSEQFALQIKNQEEAINAQIEQETSNVADKEAAQQKLETARSEVQNIYTQITAWGK